MMQVLQPTFILMLVYYILHYSITQRIQYCIFSLYDHHCRSALEQKWLIRIILKNVKVFGAGSKTLMAAYHPDAQELYDNTNDLEKTITTLANPLDRTFGIEISLFKSFSPMLADRTAINKVIARMGNKPFYVETKLDGERTQIHKEGNR